MPATDAGVTAPKPGLPEDPDDQGMVGIFIRYWEGFRRNKHSARKDTPKRPLSEDIALEAHLEHFWPDGSAAVSVHHAKIGWLEFDITKDKLPDGAVPGRSIPVTLYLGRDGSILRHQIRPEVVLAKPTFEKAATIADAEDSPEPPSDWSNEVEVARVHLDTVGKKQWSRFLDRQKQEQSCRVIP